jgi:hypothetical protein
VTTTLRPPPAPGPDASRRDARWLVVAAVLVVAVVGSVLAFGVVRPPPLAPLDAPDFDGAVAFVSWDREACLVVVGPDGASSELRCGGVIGELVAWTDEGIVLRTWHGAGPGLETVDATTGETVTRREDTEELGRPAPDVDAARVERGRLVVRDGGTVLWSVAARGSYEVAAGWTSPDGRWVALQDTADRLLLVPADGSRDPVVWAEDLDPFVPIVWRGGELPAG